MIEQAGAKVSGNMRRHIKEGIYENNKSLRKQSESERSNERKNRM